MNKNTASLMASAALCAALLAGCTRSIDTFTAPDGTIRHGHELTLTAGETWLLPGTYTHFTLTGEARTQPEAEAALFFHTDTARTRGYEMTLRGGPIDGTRKTGSLAAVRNLYRPLADDGTWFPFEIAVRGQRISISINHTLVVDYTEPATPYRADEYARRLLGRGRVALRGVAGEVSLRHLHINRLSPWQAARADTIAPTDEATDPIIRLHQEDFPVLDYHVHLKGGLTKERAAQQSRQTGINYAIAPNCGIGFPVTKDEDIYNFIDSMHTQPFILAMQAEGREWLTTFSEDARKQFDYVFSDALTFHDNKNRRTRLWINDEVWIDDEQQYMDMIVEKSCGVIAEPIDIFVNPTFLPEQMNDRYDEFWTDARIQKFVDALVKHGKALEINELYRIPGKRIIMKAKEAGVKFTFGSNNVTPDVSDLSYSLQMKKECDLKPENMYKPKIKVFE